MRFINSLIAQATKIDPDSIGYRGFVSDEGTAMDNIVDLVYFWAGIVAVIVLIVAGYFYVTARGDAAQMKRAKDATRGAVTGLIIVMVAFIITQFVLGRF